MSHINGSGDPRAHTNPEEKDRHAKSILNYAKALVLEDQPAGVDPCNECVGATIMLAIGLLVREVGKGKYADEKFGLARRLDHLEEICGKASELLVLSAVAGGAHPADYPEVYEAA